MRFQGERKVNLWARILEKIRQYQTSSLHLPKGMSINDAGKVISEGRKKVRDSMICREFAWIHVPKYHNCKYSFH